MGVQRPAHGADGGSARTARKRRKDQRNRLRARLAREGVEPAMVEVLLAELRARQDLEHELRLAGCAPALIARQVEELRVAQLHARLGAAGAIDELCPTVDDTRFRPAVVDPLLRGVARATGATARAVRTRRGLAKWQIEQEGGR